MSGLPRSLKFWSVVAVGVVLITGVAVGAALRGSPTGVSILEAGTDGDSSPTGGTEALPTEVSCIDHSVDVTADYGVARPAPGHMDPSLGPVHRSVDDFVDFGSIVELVGGSTKVVVGEIRDAPCGRVVGLFGLRNMIVSVEQTLLGVHEPEVTFEQFDWDPSTFRPLLVVDYPRFRIGQRVLVFLKPSDAPGLYRFPNFQGLYRLDGDEIDDTRRSDPLVRQIEDMTVAEIGELLAPNG